MKIINFFQLTSYGWMLLMAYWLIAGMHTKMTVKKEKGVNRVIYLFLVIVAFALVYSARLEIGFLGRKLISPNVYTGWTGLILHICGLSLALAARWKLGENWSAIVTVKKDHELIKTGAYAITRHPIYTGIFFGLAGAVIVQSEIRGVIALVLLFFALHLKIVQEEKFMRLSFPSYFEYAKKTSRIIPLLY